MNWRPRKQKRERWVGAATSLVAHLLVVVLLVSAWTDAPKMFVPTTPDAVEPPAVVVSLVTDPRPAATPTPVKKPTPAKRTRVKPPPRLKIARPVRAPHRAVSLPTGEGPTEGVSDELSGAQLAGASSADSGAPGGACDMARRVQRALRRDPLVQAAVAQAHPSTGSAFMVWNGDWVKSHGEDGKGLAAVREAIMWEVAFAPAACRAEPVRGLILISLNQGPGTARLALGSGAWRWSDLLAHRPTLSGESYRR